MVHLINFFSNTRAMYFISVSIKLAGNQQTIMKLKFYDDSND